MPRGIKAFSVREMVLVHFDVKPHLDGASELATVGVSETDKTDK